MKLKQIFTMGAAAAGAALMAAAMTAGPARADTSGTTTTLTLPSSHVAVGQESNFVMLVGVNATEGFWSIDAGSQATGEIGLCGGQLPAQTNCAIPSGALPPGTYNLIAIYNGTENFGPSTSDLESLTVVAQQPTSTSLSLLPTSTVVFGHEDSGQLVVNANGDTGNPAQGTATVLLNNSTALDPQCTSIPLFNGGNSCSLTASELQPGTYQLTARFDGSQFFASSTSSPPQTLTVLAQQPTTTGLRLSVSPVLFGNEQTETLTATVTPATGGIPTGNVIVKSGSTTVCTIILASATGRCTLTGSQLAPNSYPLIATYSGDDTYATSADTTQTLVVAKDPTTTNLMMSADTIAVGSEQAELFTVQVTSASGTPTGNVTVKAGTTAGATAVCTIILANGTGQCTLTPRQLARGSYQVTATYNADSIFEKSTSSPPQTLTVNRR